MWWASWAWAALTVQAPSECMTIEAVALDVGSVVDDDVFRRLDLDVVLVGDHLVMTLEDRGQRVWARTAQVAPEDCPSIPMLVARSVEQALAELPRWSFSAARPPEQGIALHVAPIPLGAAPRWELRVGASGPMAGRARWAAGLGIATAGLRTSEGRGADVLELLVRAGPALDLGAGAHAVRVDAMLAVGPAILVPSQETPQLESALLPAVRVEAGATWVPAGALRVGVLVGTPAIQVAIRDPASGELAASPPVRLGLKVGVARLAHRGDDRRGTWE